MADATVEDAIQFWNLYAQDPVAAHQRFGAELQQAGYQVGDPRVEAMLADYQQEQELAAYDQQVLEFCSQPGNEDIDPNLIHTFVAAAEGDFAQAAQMYRNHAAQFLVQAGTIPEPGPTSRNYVPGAPQYQEPQGHTAEQRLHNAIDQAAAAARAARR